MVSSTVKHVCEGMVTSFSQVLKGGHSMPRLQAGLAACPASILVVLWFGNSAPAGCSVEGEVMLRAHPRQARWVGEQRCNSSAGRVAIARLAPSAGL